MVFPNVEEAQAARGRIASGLSFDDLAKERGLNPSDIDLGTIAKSAMIDPAIADAAFSLAPDDVSQPVQGRFGTALVKVGKIEPGTQPTYESVAPNLKREIAAERARAQVASLHDKMEDERGGGASVVEAAQKLGLDRRHHRCRRPLRPRAERPAGCRHSAGPQRRHAGLLQRRRRRQRSDPVRRRLCLVRRSRHHAVARTRHRRGQGPGRGALARRPDRQPAARQGDRNGPETQSGRQARR